MDWTYAENGGEQSDKEYVDGAVQVKRKVYSPKIKRLYDCMDW